MDLSLTVRVVVADPQPVFRYGLRLLLDSTEHLRVVGEAADPSEAMDAVRQLQPDVLVMTPGNSAAGLDALRTLAKLPKPVRCIVVTNGESEDTQFKAAAVPLGCLLPRDSTGPAFVSCIQCVMRHQCWPVRRTEDVIAAAAPVPNGARKRYGLTSRETQIVTAVADGASNKDIAVKLAISEDTVKHHMSNIFDKVGVHSRLELALFALYHGVVQWA